MNRKLFYFAAFFVINVFSYKHSSAKTIVCEYAYAPDSGVSISEDSLKYAAVAGVHKAIAAEIMRTLPSEQQYLLDYSSGSVRIISVSDINKNSTSKTEGFINTDAALLQLPSEETDAQVAGEKIVADIAASSILTDIQHRGDSLCVKAELNLDTAELSRQLDAHKSVGQKAAALEKARQRLLQSQLDVEKKRSLIAQSKEKTAAAPQVRHLLPVMLDNNNNDTAENDFYEAVANYYQKITSIDSTLVIAYNNRGFACYKSGSYIDAIACYRRALALDPYFTHAYYILGNIYTLLSDYPKAIACYSAATGIDSTLAAAYNNMGYACEQQHEFERAFFCYQKAVAADPKLAAARNNMALLYSAQGNNIEAAACYRDAVGIDKQYVCDYNYMLGLTYYNRRNYSQAFNCFQNAVRANYYFESAHYYLGLTYLEQGKRKKAIVSLRTAAQMGSVQSQRWLAENGQAW